MAKITISLVHEFDNGQQSSTVTTIGALGASEAAVLEQTFVPIIQQSLQRLGRFNATVRDANFPAMLTATQDIMNGKISAPAATPAPAAA
ncbi:MAG: hypothetical protein IPJ61_18360 [Tessaracoccus sp.]|uniref:hypothetical protein n=1 Tax=Tessaracoccus sp. TaxID=1971211 RepID=UPI001ECD3941|nr:hypothetical protein [Tessaracoccus sp.]MBK7822948.1 hypothetical protein [Tessaracoccus sp.]